MVVLITTLPFSFVCVWEIDDGGGGWGMVTPHTIPVDLTLVMQGKI